MKKVFFLAALLVCSIAAQAQRFALVDMEYILKQIPAYEQANQQMESLSKQWQSEVEAKAQEAKTMYDEYQKNASNLSATQKTAQENAIIAKEWPDDPTMSLDDARYSVLRYLPSETENAYGPRIVDPRSGEIMESHICWYHNVMNLLKKWYMVQCGPLDKRAQSMTFDDKLMGTLIQFVSSHEVGHTLGLRHNMAARSATPVEKLRDKAWVEANGHTVSIMDYARFNYVAQPEDRISEKGLFPRIGDYDKWAIKWGYQYRPEFKDPFKEKAALRAEVTKKLKGDHRLLFIGDEGKGSDPRSQSEDLGDNNMKANEYGIKNLEVKIKGPGPGRESAVRALGRRNPTVSMTT